MFGLCCCCYMWTRISKCVPNFECCFMYVSAHVCIASQERAILGTAVGFPDAMRFKGAAPEIINSRCIHVPHV